ncbi:MAG: hypothetical protein M1837_005200 [Sclerophora amabilis]|nr:MAG: hypothetical protein M1837_005200 [Sclerophora amabilis]
MTSYDSDSSGEDDSGYTDTNVLLGYASKEPTDDTVSQLGGYPTWLDPNIPPSSSLATCKVCNTHMTLLLQLNGDLPEHFPGHERRLYIFGCRRKACRRKPGCMRAVRGVRATKIEQKKERGSSEEIVQNATKAEQRANVGEALFNTRSTSSTSSSANPFSTSSSIAAATISNRFSSTQSTTPSASSMASQLPSLAAKPSQTPASPPSSPSPPPPESSSHAPFPDTFASKLSLSSNNSQETQRPKNPPDPWPPTTSLPPAYPTSYLDADYETLFPSSTTSAQQTSTSLPTDDTTTSRTTTEETFESPLDKPFLRFADRLAHNPLQVLRYEFRGTPLLYSHADAAGKALAPYQPVQPQQQQQSSHKQASFPKITTTGAGSGGGGGGGGGGMPRCANCGTGRVYELQLTPQAIAELETDEESVDGMDWGTVILGVCGADCVPLTPDGGGGGEDGVQQTGQNEGVAMGYLEEWLGVQWEELGVKQR